MVCNEFEQIVTLYFEPLYKFAYSLTRTEADAKDLTQQTFYLWATKGHQLRERAKVKTWLFTTLHRAFLDNRRKQTRFPHESLHEIPTDDMEGASPDFVNEADLPEVLLALGKIGEVNQSAVALFYLEDYSYDEIAEILAVPVGTVKSRLARGIVQLRGILGVVESESDSTVVRRRVNGDAFSRDGAAIWSVCKATP
jgi:RNA polymerase sigma-70 factor (ECF subfamily)